MYNIAEIKQRITCVDVAQRCGLPVHHSGDRCISPLRSGAKNPSSFVVDDDFWYDFGAGHGGDCIDLLAEIKHGGDRGAAIRELARLTGVPDDNQKSANWMQYTQNLCNQVAFWQTQLTDGDRDYLHSRGITDGTIDTLKLGRTEEGRLAIPYIKNGYVCYTITRYLSGGKYPEAKYRKQKRDSYNDHIVWGLDTLSRETPAGETSTLVIAEGAFDVMSFWQAGYPCLSAITGHFSRDQLPVVLSAARKFERVLLVYDNDPDTKAGEKFTARMARILTQHKIPFVAGVVPAPYHDVSEYYAAGGDLAVIVSNASDGLTYLAKSFVDYDALESFMLSIARYTKRSRLDEIFNGLYSSARWNDQRLKQLQKSCATAPPENVVADELMRKYQLLYVNAVGFYEYVSRGVWVRQSDGAIKYYADRAYGEFSTAQRIAAVCNLLKVRTLRDVEFDRRPLWNFINGTLELETGLFRDHNPNDYCSIQASYPYEPNAECPAFRQFIHDVTGGDPKSEELLQFIPGYALFHNCPHEKIFVLTGSGGNGKSKYLDVLGHVLGEENCSHITPRDLLDKFQRIKLKDAILNIAGEIKSNIGAAEEIMKLIASGETISACYKGEQFVDYRSRAKLVYACNGQLTSEDTSEGLARRLIIVDFKQKFVECPDPNDPVQRRKDIHIGDRLTEEINTGGVFNWVYAGYKLLRAVGYFTDTDDQSSLIDDFKRASNPVLLFWEDRFVNPGDFPPELKNPQIYSDYRDWCVDNGFKFRDSRWFGREFRNVSYRKYVPYRNSEGRGYRLTTIETS